MPPKRRNNHRRRRSTKPRAVNTIDAADPPSVNTHPWYRMVVFFQYDDATVDHTIGFTYLNNYFNEMYGLTPSNTSAYFEFRVVSVRAWGPVDRSGSTSVKQDLGMECYSIIDLGEVGDTTREPLYIKLDYAGVNKRSHLKYVYPKAHRDTIISYRNASEPFVFVNGCELVYVTVLWRFHRSSISTIRGRMLQANQGDWEEEEEEC